MYKRQSLHKRGYRKLTARAPIAENLAAALIMLTPWRGNRILVDPFCGSGTFPIEDVYKRQIQKREKRNRSVCSRIFPFTVYTVLLSAGIAGIHRSFHR